MRPSRMPTSISGCLVIALLCGVQILGHAGCSTSLRPSDFDPSNPYGLFLNKNLQSDSLGAIQLPTGESVFVFGRFLQSGLIEEIDGLVLRDANGDEAYVTLENGHVKTAKSFDGSTVELTYEEISTRRIKGKADLDFKQLDEADQSQSVPFDIDLQQAAADLADQVRDLVGLDISDEEPPEQPDGKSALADAKALSALANLSSGVLDKDSVRSQLILVFAQFHIATLAALGYIIVEVMAALVEIVFEVLVAVVVALTQAIVIAMFLPIILLGEVLRLATQQPLFAVDIEVDLGGLPRHPR